MKQTKPRTKDKRPVRRLCRIWTGVLLMAVVGASFLTAGKQGMAAEASESGRQGRVVMYVFDEAGLSLRDEHAALVDQLNYSFALLKNGEATGSHWRQIRQVENYLRRHPHIDGVLSVGGWGAEGFSDACATAEGRQRLADSILRLMDAHGFVGVDIDWEYPGSSAAGIKSHPEDVENWYALLALLRQGLDARQAAAGRPYYLSVALGGGEAQLNSVDGARLDELVDQAVLMAYDLSGFDKTTGHHAGLYPGDDRPNSGAHMVKVLAASGLSRSKMILGFPAYGRVWRQVSGGGDGLHQRAATSGNKTLSFPELQVLEKQGYTAHYDEAACAAWWFDGANFVSGESADSVAAKVRWLREKGLQGAAVWCWNQDREGSLMALLDAALR